MKLNDFSIQLVKYCRCSSPMVHNGYNIYTKKGLGDIKIGRYKCSNCNCTPEENRSFWEGLKSVLFDSLDDFVRLLRSHNVSHEGISAVMDFIYPRSKSTILREFSKNMGQEKVSHDENVLVVCYDEQHPKKGRCQKYRLTLFDPKTQRPLTDELFDDKSSETIKNFLKKHLDTSEPVFISVEYPASLLRGWKTSPRTVNNNTICLLYTSDAADDLLCVDLGGCRIIKKKK